MNPQFAMIDTLAHEREDEIRREATQHHNALTPASGRRRQFAALLREVADRIAPRYSSEYADEQSR